MAKSKSSNTVAFDEFIRSQFDGVMVGGHEYVDRPREIVPTVLSLDIALSGGIPEGKVVLFSGKAKGGKSTLCLTIGRNAIRQGRKFFFVDVEHRMDPALVRTIRGLNPADMTLIRSTDEHVLSAEDYFRIMERGVKDNPRSVWVVDSLAMLSTLSEQSEATGENRDMSGVPKLMASFLRKIKDIVDVNNCIMIFISQFQTNRDPASRKKFEEKGGLGIQYGCSVWMTLDWFQVWKKDDRGECFGQDIHITIRASALGKPYRPCAIPLRFGEGIDEALDVINHAENLGLIQRSGSWYTIPGMTVNGDTPKFQGGDNLRQILLDNPDMLEQLDRSVREIVLPDSVNHDDQTAEREDDNASAKKVPKKGRKSVGVSG